ncbi:MAG: hypothetical protein COT73_04760 [Bdellovibrio sp. CG10_big_fil_rev_8_21_14_0_10_47_8]|nr:MAG: hypothetical protein COT73_04760 [Bdellovibrio sp. CG10_big_fil_rev_8_21_14_0_10_47_8]
MKKIIFSFALFSVAAFADSHSKHEKHREHEAHVHGSGSLAIAFDANKGKIEFLGAAEGILGFEYQPRTAKDKKAAAEATERFEKDIGKIVQMDPALKCQFTKDLIGQVPEKGEEGSGKHSDWAANFSVSCAKDPVGTKIKVDFSSFERIKDVDITVLAGAIQKSVEYKGSSVIIDLN